MVEYDSEMPTITVIVGIDGQVPPLEMQRNMVAIVEGEVWNATDGEGDVTLTINEHPSQEQISVLGNMIQYIAHFDVSLGGKFKEINQGIVNSTHNTVVDAVSDSGFSIEGTATVWDGGFHS